MSLRAQILERLRDAPERGWSAMQIARPPGRDALALGEVLRELGEAWEDGDVEGWPSGPYRLARVPAVQLTISEDAA